MLIASSMTGANPTPFQASATVWTEIPLFDLNGNQISSKNRWSVNKIVFTRPSTSGGGLISFRIIGTGDVSISAPFSMADEFLEKGVDWGGKYLEKIEYICSAEAAAAGAQLTIECYGPEDVFHGRMTPPG